MYFGLSNGFSERPTTVFSKDDFQSNSTKSDREFQDNLSVKAYIRGSTLRLLWTRQVLRLLRYQIRVTGVFLKPIKHGIVSGDAKTRYTDP